MAKFMFIYRSEAADPSEMTPEQMQQAVQKWMTWIQGGVEAGWMIDGGDGLLPMGKVVKADGTVIDGPFAESKELVGGYSLIEAKDLDEAVKFTANCPSFGYGGNVEVRAMMNTKEM